MIETFSCRNGGLRSPNPAKPNSCLWSQGGNKHNADGGGGDNGATNSSALIDVFQEREGG